MASVILEDDEDSRGSFSDYSQFSVAWDENTSEGQDSIDDRLSPNEKKTMNITKSVINRQIFGRFAKNPRARTEKVFTNVHNKCRYPLSELIKDRLNANHIFMGFTVCGKYFLSYTERLIEDFGALNFDTWYEYELYIWCFIPGQRLKFISKHKIFKHLKDVLDKIMFMQSAKDYYKIVCYGLATLNPDLVYISILTLPCPKNCKHCNGFSTVNDESLNQGWCVEHGFMVHYMFSMSQPSPVFNPNISLAYPNHLVISTGHHIHILNVTTVDPSCHQTISLPNLKDEEIKFAHTPTHSFNDALSEVSESNSEYFGVTHVVDAILDDFSEYDLESNECNKPFHELNISCEPLNVTGKSYHNTLIQNIVDPRIKRWFSVSQGSSSQKSTEKSKIDKKIAEKTYEFIEENEKCEKISSFRKKRLAEKKYEFSEDNNENIVPFNSLRRERRYRFQSRSIRSPDFNSIFLSPRSSGLRSPMQSPNSRSSQTTRNIYCPSLRNSPHYSKSPISPKDSARKFNVYSPSLDSDCSDSDSRLILRGNSTLQACDKHAWNGLLIVDPKLEHPKWIRKIVKRYSNGDFENGSLVSGQSRDDYNTPIEIPVVVQNLTDQQLDVVPDFKVDQVTEMQLIITQRSFDCEQFVQRRAQRLCADAHLEFMHFQDYDIKIIHVCPLNGQILCQAVITIGAHTKSDPSPRLEYYSTDFLFTWNIETDDFNMEESTKLCPSSALCEVPRYEQVVSALDSDHVWVLEFNTGADSKFLLRDSERYFEIYMRPSDCPVATRPDLFWSQVYSSDSDD